MKTRWLLFLVLFVGAALPLAAGPKGKTVVHQGPHGRTVVHQGPRGKVVIHQGFPIARPLPLVYVRAPRVVVRVTPRIFLPRLAFPAVVVRVRPVATRVVWHQAVVLRRDDEWLEDTLVVTHAGTHLYFEVADGPARVSFAEVVYDNGETQVVDFDDKVYQPGFYGLIDLPQSRGIDHVRLVAAAGGDTAGISLHLAL
jgi:hypothetical protein